jgi:hypothetical protein
MFRSRYSFLTVIKQANGEKYFQRLFFLMVFVALNLVLSACGSLQKMAEQTVAVYQPYKGVDGVLSHTAETRSVHIINSKDKYKFCAEPAPDVGIGRSAKKGLELSFMNFGGSSESAGEKESSIDTELTGRTGYILLARELGYRQCETAQNFKINYDQYKKIHQYNLDLLLAVGSIEAQNSIYQFGVTEKIIEGSATTSVTTTSAATTSAATTSAAATTSTGGTSTNSTGTPAAEKAWTKWTYNGVNEKIIFGYDQTTCETSTTIKDVPLSDGTTIKAYLWIKNSANSTTYCLRNPNTIATKEECDDYYYYWQKKCYGPATNFKGSGIDGQPLPKAGRRGF